MKIYYVYIAYGKDDEILYIGKGKNKRYKHCLSGTSQSQALNRYYFNNGEDGSIYVKKYQEGLTEEEALELEEKTDRGRKTTLQYDQKRSQ